MDSLNLSFIGLGVMGFPMAGHLARAGHSVTVYNRTAAKAEAWVAKFGAQFRGKSAPTPAEAASGAELVFACVGNDDDLRQVTVDTDGAFAGMGAGSIFVDHTTASADVARELAQAAAARGIAFLDAPVSGGQAGAENGQLTVMAGGDAAAFEAARPVIACFAKAVTLMGPSGAGQLTKMVNQICIAGLLQGLSEGLAFAERAGLDGKRVLEVIGKGAAQSWQMDNRGPTMLEDRFDFGFAVDWMRKDLSICLAEAGRNGAALPVAAMVAGFYDELARAGGGRRDTSSLIRRLRDK
jgi:3-hydroxyisobutyrate dehydrogenase-like beta-hydroxyacid dehydrogenase